MQLRVITDENEFFQLRDEWNALLSKSSANCIYLTWEWLFTWWKIFKQSRKLLILTVYDNNQLIGIAPMLIRKVRYFYFLGFIRIEFLGIGENENDEVGSNYLDFIILTGKESEVLELFVEFFTQQSSVKWEELILSSIRVDSICLVKLKKILEDKTFWIVEQLRITPCLFAPLTHSWEDYLNSIGSKTRRDLRRDRRLLEENGELKYEVFDNDNTGQFLDDFIEIHKNRWKDKLKSDAFSSVKFISFQRQMIELCATKHWVKISFLKHKSKIIAASYHYQYNNVIFGYQLGCDSHYDKRLSLGKLEYGFNIEDSIMKGFKEFDFYKSNMSGYKPLLAKGQRSVADFRIYKNNFKGKLYDKLKYFKKTIRVNIINKIKSCLGKTK